jgi:hypothetical protein
MKNESQPAGTPEAEAENPAYDDAPEPDVREGRSGEGAHSAMKHWLHEERNRIKRPEH